MGGGFEGLAVDIEQESKIAARAVHGKEVDAFDPFVFCVFDGIDDAVHDLFAGKAKGLHLQVAGCYFDQGIACTQLDMSVDVGPNAARKAPDFRVQICREDALDGLRVFFRNTGKARFNSSKPEFGELGRDFELVLGGKADAGRLLAVAKRRVVKTNGLAAVESLLNDINLVEWGSPNLICLDVVHAHSPTGLGTPTESRNRPYLCLMRPIPVSPTGPTRASLYPVPAPGERPYSPLVKRALPTTGTVKV